MYTFVQLAIFFTYITVIVLFWNESDHETECYLNETYMNISYEYDLFLCRHSLRRAYYHLSFLLFFLSAFFIFVILAQLFWLFKGYRTVIKERLNSSVMDITADQRFIMTIVYNCKKGYLSNFCQLYNKDLYKKVNRYIAHCKYPYKYLESYFRMHEQSLKLKNIAALPFSITRIEDIFLLEIVDSDFSITSTLDPLKDLKRLQQLVLNFCRIQIFDVGVLPEGIVLLDILSNPLKEVKGTCPDSLKICILDKNVCSVVCENFKTVVLLNEKVIRWHTPINWQNILSYLTNESPVQISCNPGVVHIFNARVNIDDNERITESNNSEFDFDRTLKDVLFLKVIFSLLKFEVHLHGANDIADYICRTINKILHPKMFIFIFMGDVGSKTIVNLIAKFPRLDYLSPAVSISLMEDSTHNVSTLELQTSVWNILYAFVPEASFQDNLIRYLKSEHEDDLATTIKGWKNVRIHDFLYKKVYLHPGFPYLSIKFFSRIEKYVEGQKETRRLNSLSPNRRSTRNRDDVTFVSNSAANAAASSFRGCTPSCVEFKIRKTWKQFRIEETHINSEFDIMYMKIKREKDNLPEPVKLDSSPICGPAFVMGYPENQDSDLIVESHCQVYKDQKILERDINDVQKLLIMENEQFNQHKEYKDLLKRFEENNIYVIRLPVRFTEICRSGLVVCLNQCGEPCVKAFYNNRYPESLYSSVNPYRCRELLFQSALKSSIIERTLSQ